MRKWILWIVVVILVIAIALYIFLYILQYNKLKEKKGTFPSGGIQPGAPEGSIDESFLGTTAARGIRNNNPGNIKISNNAWQGKISEANNTDHTFEQFVSISYGIRAMIINLRTYMNRGTNTVRSIIDTYDRPFNYSYINFVTAHTGFTENQVLQPDKQTLKKLVQAMTAFECGKEIVTDARFETAYSIV